MAVSVKKWRWRCQKATKGSQNLSFMLYKNYQKDPGGGGGLKKNLKGGRKGGQKIPKPPLFLGTNPSFLF